MKANQLIGSGADERSLLEVVAVYEGEKGPEACVYDFELSASVKPKDALTTLRAAARAEYDRLRDMEGGPTCPWNWGDLYEALLEECQGGGPLSDGLAKIGIYVHAPERDCAALLVVDQDETIAG